MGTPTRDDPNHLSQAATYQAIIIALVAGAILIIALGSLIYKRRRRRQWIDQITRNRARDEENDRRWVELNDGRVLQLRTGRNRGAGGGKKSLVREPVVWDVGLGNEKAEAYPDIEDYPDGKITHRHGGEELDEDEEVGVDGVLDEGWKPLSATLPDHKHNSSSLDSPPIPTTKNIELSILIAMPTPTPLHSATTSTSSLSLSKPTHLDDYPVLHSLQDTDYLPSLEIGSTRARVAAGADLDSWAKVTRDIDERYKRHQKLANRTR